MSRIYKRKCDFCKKDYKGKGSRFCSLKCYFASRKGKVKIKCVICGKERLVKFHLSKTAKFCSRECYYKDPERIKRMLGNKLGTGQKKGATWKLSEETKAKHRLLKGELSPMWGKKWSKEARLKMSLARKGKRTGAKNNFWKGGITKLQIKIRSSWDYKEWRKAVYKRDNWVCQKCKSSGKANLEAHHIKAFSKILKENNIKTLQQAIQCKDLWNINNGLTLCIDCHRKTDNYGNLKIL